VVRSKTTSSSERINEYSATRLGMQQWLFIEILKRSCFVSVDVHYPSSLFILGLELFKPDCLAKDSLNVSHSFCCNFRSSDIFFKFQCSSGQCIRSPTCGSWFRFSTLRFRCPISAIRDIILCAMQDPSFFARSLNRRTPRSERFNTDHPKPLCNQIHCQSSNREICDDQLNAAN
jgi:hypothetical protein